MPRSAIRVLLVDDDPDDHDLLRRLLAKVEGARYQLDCVFTYEEGRQAVQRCEHDVYLIDYRLGEHDGIELIREVAREGCRAPTLLMTARGSYDADLEAMEAQVTDYLDKQRLDPVLLERAIRYAMRQKEVEQALQDARDSLEARVAERTAELTEAQRLKDQFMATLGHELRSPLAAIGNGVHLLRHHGAGQAAVLRTCDMLERQLDQVTRLVSGLQEAARLQSGMLHIRKERVDLSPLVTQGVEACRALIEEHRHQLSLSLPAEPLWVDADADRLVQVLCNLLENAALYTNPGGRISVAADRDEDSVLMRVRDTGIGIAPEARVGLFQLFTRTPEAQGRSQKGMGIGLALARGLVEMHEGSVEVYSDGPGHGSEFVVRLPQAAAHPS